MKKKCEVEGCGRLPKAKSLCDKHYKRLWRGGEPRDSSCYDLSPEERLKSKLGPPDPVTGCIEWTGFRLKKMGYGRIRRGGDFIYAHRLAYELKHGPIPKGLCVCHRCDNPPCCNDEHLYLDTHAGNMADMVLKGRSLKGSKSPNAKLTEKDVTEIRRRLAAGELQREIAVDLQIARPYVSMIKSGKGWAHLK